MTDQRQDDKTVRRQKQPGPNGEGGDKLPETIGRYRVKKLLGEGSFGRVYLAHDDQLQRLVAVKVPHRKLVTRPEDAAAYLTEARTVAGLDHPHIVPVYDVGGTEDCPFFVVSKFIEGSDLKRTIQQGRLSFHESAALVAAVADALHHAHRKGLVHRDVKPGNILLDAGGKAYVADFGLALREQDVGKGPRYVGTPAYMSPEQVRGEGHRVDGRSDIFSLGVVLYELLTGRRPFQADSRDGLMGQITSREVRPPRQWEDTIPKELAGPSRAPGRAPGAPGRAPGGPVPSRAPGRAPGGPGRAPGRISKNPNRPFGPVRAPGRI
jgi:serine/threonine protein kinase